MKHNQFLCASLQAKIHEQIERTEHLISLVPEGRTDWAPAIPGAWPVGILVRNLLDCLAGFSAVLYSVAPAQLVGLLDLRELPVTTHLFPSAAPTHIARYPATISTL